MTRTVALTRLRDRLLRDPEVRAAYEAQSLEFAIARTVIQARKAAKLSQVELAERMQTSQSAIARLESGKSLPNIVTLGKLADATGRDIKLTIPAKPSSRKSAPVELERT